MRLIYKALQRGKPPGNAVKTSSYEQGGEIPQSINFEVFLAFSVNGHISVTSQPIVVISVFRRQFRTFDIFRIQ